MNSVEIQNRKFVKDYLVRDSLFLGVADLIPSLLSEIERTKEFRDTNDEKLIMCIPEDACWNCLSRYIKDLEKIGNKFHVKPFIVSSSHHLRNLRLYLEKEQLKGIIICPIENLGKGSLLSGLKQNSLFLICKPGQQLIIPYLESKAVDPVNFLISNYYEIKN